MYITEYNFFFTPFKRFDTYSTYCCKGIETNNNWFVWINAHDNSIINYQTDCIFISQLKRLDISSSFKKWRKHHLDCISCLHRISFSTWNLFLILMETNVKFKLKCGFYRFYQTKCAAYFFFLLVRLHKVLACQLSKKKKESSIGIVWNAYVDVQNQLVLHSTYLFSFQVFRLWKPKR